MKRMLCDPEFDINEDLLIIASRKSKLKRPYSTPYTLVQLNYDASDIVDRLMELNINEYSETLFDKDNDRPPLLFVFGKIIDEKEVYIKLKIKEYDDRKCVLCLSFHYAERKMEYPYLKRRR